MAAKRKLAVISTGLDESSDPLSELRFLCLGGGTEVGRSCHIIQYGGKTIMLDAGMHPAYDGLAALPFFDEFDLSTVDVLLISHFHIDHAASLPYVLSKTNFRGRVFMTHSTKAIYKWLIQDSVRVGNTASSSEQRVQLYTEADHLSTFSQIEAMDYHTTHTVSAIRITPYPAGHVLGAAMYLIEIAGLKILFTGDYSMEHDRHLVPAEVPKNVKIDVLITESTFGISSHTPRLEREAALMKAITTILNRGGRALLPVFALGRAQELLLILDEYWTKHPEYQKIPIYYASNLARKCMAVYQTYIGTMNDNIKKLFRDRMADAETAGDNDVTRGGPWDFRFIRSLKSLDRFEDVGGCVMLASPGMLQSGVSRELLERWAPDSRNGVIFTGYSVEGTMAKVMMTEPDTIPAITASRSTNIADRSRGHERDQQLITRRCSVEEYSFAAHVDGQENRAFIEQVNAPVVILVHGEKNNMLRLKSKLLSLNANKPIHLKTKVFSPANCEEVRIPIQIEKLAKVVGRLADQVSSSVQLLHEDGSEDKRQRAAGHDTVLNGVLVQNDLKLSLMDAQDLREFAGLSTSTILCRQKITLAAASPKLIFWALEGVFGGLSPLDADNDAETNGHIGNKAIFSGRTEDAEHFHRRYLVMDTVTITHGMKGELEIEWEGNLMNDGIADAVMAVLASVESSPASIRESSHVHTHEQPPTNGHTTLPKQDSVRVKTNPHHSLPPEARLSRLLLLLEAQFGVDAVTPIMEPRDAGSVSSNKQKSTKTMDDESSAMDVASEMEQLSVPGLQITIDKHVALLWLNDLSVECSNAVLRDRIMKVLVRGVECCKAGQTYDGERDIARLCNLVADAARL